MISVIIARNDSQLVDSLRKTWRVHPAIRSHRLTQFARKMLIYQDHLIYLRLVIYEGVIQRDFGRYFKAAQCARPFTLWKQAGPFSLVFFTYLILSKNRDLESTWPKMHSVYFKILNGCSIVLVKVKSKIMLSRSGKVVKISNREITWNTIVEISSSHILSLLIL